MSPENSNREQSASHTVIEALYDLPLGGNWTELQSALCQYWTANSSGVSNTEIEALERHFERALSFLEQLPARPERWLNELYRMPVPACVFDAAGELLDANKAGKEHLGFTQGDFQSFPAEASTAIKKSIRQLAQKRLTATTIISSNGAATHLYLSQLPKRVTDTALLYLGVVVTNDLPTSGMKLLAERCELTPSETDLCLQLSSGKSLDALAQDAKVKKTTLRTHLANCFSKLGVSSQPELVSLVLHSVFAGAQLDLNDAQPPVLTPYLDPEIHGYPKYSKCKLVDGRTLGFFEYGDPDGIPALYLHGSLDSGLFTKSQRLAGNGMRLIAVERGGVGESTPNPDPSPSAYAQDLVSLVDHLGLTEYMVIGRSMGSWDAVSLVLADPSRAKLLVFAGGRLPVTKSSDHLEHSPFYRSLYNAIWHSKTMGRLVLRIMQVQIMTRGVASILSEEGLSDLEVSLIREPRHLKHLKSQWLRSGCHGADPINEHLKLYRLPVADPPWRDLQTPVLIIHGEEDQNVPLKQLLKQTDTFPNREVVVLPGIGHMLVHVAMGEVLRLVRKHWAQLT